MTRNIFLCKYLAYHIYKPMPMDEKISKNLKLDFSGPKGLLFCLKSTIVPWTGNELAGDDVENCENSQLTLKKSLTFF